MLREFQNGWCRSVLTAMLTVTMSGTLLMQATVLAQPASRISARESDLNDLNRMLNDGVRGPQGVDFRSDAGSLLAAPQVDLSRVDTRALENLLSESVAEAERLYRLLDADYRRYPELRPLLSDLVTLRSRAARLAQDVQAKIPLDRSLPQFQQLDSDWRLLSHQLTQSPRVSRTTLESVTRLDGLGRQIEKMFKMDPQLDRRQILMELSALRGSLRNLIEELELDPSGSQQTLDMVFDARKLEQQVARIQGMVLDQVAYDGIVTEYNRYGQMWTRLATRLRPLDNRYIERAVGNIINADDTLHNLMWLEKTSNRERLKQVADGLTRDVDEFFNRTPLKLLLTFKDVASILETADTFYGVVQNLRDNLNRNESDQVILESYSYVEEYGNEFIRSFAGLRSQAGRVVLKEIEDGIIALRNDLNLSGSTGSGSVDTRSMLPVAANLENLADHLNFDVRTWLGNSRETYRDQAMQASARFVQRSQRVHRLLQARPAATELEREVAALYDDWRQVYQYLGRCNTADRAHIAYLARDISEAILQLRAPLELAMR